MHKSSYTIDKTTPILIYSGGFYGKGYARRLLSAGYNVKGIIDINPEGVQDSPVAVVTPELAHQQFGDAFIWFCLRDIIQHLSIAKKLMAFGYERFLLLPFFLDNKYAKKMISAYNSFCLGNYEVEIPCFNYLWNVRAMDYVLDENSGYVTALIHKNHIYGVKRNADSPSLSNPFSNETLSDDDFAPLSFFADIYRDIFDNQRNDLFQAFESALYSSMDYFINCAGYATLKENINCWHVVDGCRRSSFLLSKGFNAIPLRMKKEEWEIYFKESKAQKLMDYCKQLEYLPLEIEHPAFLRFPVKKCNPDTEFLKLYKDLCLQ